jgi:hypothetical protein
MKVLKIISLFTLLTILVTCKKDSTDSDVPNTYVDVYLYLTQPSWNSLQTVTNWMYVSGGVRGIFVYHYAQDQFVAIERTCTYQSSNASAQVSIDTANTSVLKDASCGSEFLRNDGSVAHGPATVPLKRYQTSYNATTKVLHIYN